VQLGVRSSRSGVRLPRVGRHRVRAGIGRSHAIPIVLAAGLLALFAPVTLPPPAARADIGAPADLRSSEADGTSATSLSVTTAQAVPAGGSIIVIAVSATFGLPLQPLSAACSDSAGHIYSTDVSKSGGTALTTICSTHAIAAQLVAGSTITVKWAIALAAPFTERAHAFAVTGLASAPLDQTASASGTGASPSSSATATTTQANELLFGVVMDQGAAVSSAGFSPGTNGTANPCAAGATPTYTSLGGVGSTTAGPSLFGMSCVVSATGAYAAQASVTDNPMWQALIATYKAAANAPTPTSTSTPTPTATRPAVVPRLFLPILANGAPLSPVRATPSASGR
jgi:hypothetical protein